MYYAFAIVKRVRAALRALRAPRLSEPAWRSRACSYAAVHTCHYTYVCLYVCVCVFTFSRVEKRGRERERGSKKGEEEEGLLGRCSHRRISQTPFPNSFSLVSSSSFLSLSLYTLHSVHGVGATRIRRSVQGEGVGRGKFRVSWAEFAGLSRLIREGIRKRAE